MPNLLSGAMDCRQPAGFVAIPVGRFLGEGNWPLVRSGPTL